MPRFNFRLIFGLGLILLGAAGLVVIVLFMVMRFRPSAPADQAGGGVGALPGIGEGPSGQIQEEGEGGLPGISGQEGVDSGQGVGTGISDQGSGISAVAQGGKTAAQVVVDGFPVSATVSPSGGVNYYDAGEYKFYTTSADGTKRLLSDEEFFGVSDVVWSPQGDSALIQHVDGTTEWYEFTRKRRAVLPRDVVDPGFRPDGQAIGYKLDTVNADDNWVVVSSPDGSAARAVQALGAKGGQVDVAWSPDNKIVALFRESRGIDREEVFFIGLEGENFRSLDVQGSLFEGRWSPDGGKILYHTVLAGDGYRPNLWVAEAGAGGVRRQFSLGLRTWVDRCAFSGDSRRVYCAVPQSLPVGAGLVKETARGIGYDVWLADTATGRTELLAVPVRDDDGGQIIDIRRLELSPDGNWLFVHTWSRVYRIRLR